MSAPRVAAIKAAVCQEFGCSMIDLDSYRKATSLPRQVAMYLARELTPHSLPELGRMFHRDHTTVLYGCNKIAHALIDGDAALGVRVAELRQMLQA